MRRSPQDPTFRDFVCLYIAEGYKRSQAHGVDRNSDPAVVALATAWIRRLTTRPAARSGSNTTPDQDPEKLVRILEREAARAAESFRVLRKSNSNQLTGRVWRSRYGVLSVTVSDTYLRARCRHGWI